MKRILLFVTGLLLAANTASAGSNWHSIDLAIGPADAPKFVAALDKLMGSTGGDLTGTVTLMATVAGGEGPTSHSVISSFESRAAREKWLEKLYASPAWATFTKATAGMSELTGSSRLEFVKSWGDQNDKDVFWEIYGFDVAEADDFVDALDKLMASDAAKKLPGQVHLSSVTAAGFSPATHAISVGFESEAEAEAWMDTFRNTKDYKAYRKATAKISDRLGAFMIRSLKTWGSPAPVSSPGKPIIID